ncbi:bacteriophage abortive infection AbiH family protein [Xanthomonas arboricola]|uniref:bacteriophage abortive infection AbiH family protein n=1 Tax=Xanthomonas arboricola TaxID=56448 RepID=UPI0020194428|nr:bacteriophage abortive infection AbiH family protein [Xanthomonas arboricola]UQQ12620.1 bacteriophage abortive infection AbiH family protein [Xanthomonas arboricola pv. corylina]
MHPTHLYIVGNGFDLWHGIPSSLGEFKEYVLTTNRQIYREVEDYLPAGENWCDLELALAELDPNMLVDNLGHFMGDYGAEDWSDSGHHDFQYEVGNVVERLSIGLRARFAEWIRGLSIPSRDNAPRRLAKLGSNALYLTFNYTSTLSKLYDIDPARVLHIHDHADDAADELVLGHAWNPQSRVSLNDRPDIEEIDTRLMEANDIIDNYFSATFKRSEELVALYKPFFDSLRTIEQVIVLGHSLSRVDSTYFRALLQQPSVAAARWTVACRSAQEWPDKEQWLIAIGLRPGAAQPALWDAL